MCILVIFAILIGLAVLAFGIHRLLKVRRARLYIQNTKARSDEHGKRLDAFMKGEPYIPNSFYKR